MQKEEYFIKNACYSVTKSYLCKQNNKRSLLGRKQRSQVARSFPNRYLFSCVNKVTSLFSDRYIFIIILHRKYHTFTPQIPYFRTAKTILSHRKNPLFAPQKPIGDKLGGSQKRFVKIIIVAETNISHTQNKTLSSLLEYHFLNHYNRLYRVRITI